MNTGIQSPPGIWWKPAHRAEKIWVGIAFAWCMVLFAMMPLWHLKGEQNPAGIRYRVDPQKYMARTQEFIDAYRVGEQDGNPIVAPPPGSDVYLLGQMWRWTPILNEYDKHGVDVCYEIHPGEDMFDGATFEMFLAAVKNHKRCCINYDPSHFVLQHLDYLAFIDIYHERIKAFHVKDAEFNPDGRQGVYSGFQPWVNRAGRFRSLGDGQVDFGAVFSKLAAYDYDSWAVLEWECCLKDSVQGAAEGAPFIASHIIKVTEKSFDDFTARAIDKKQVQRMLGI